MSYNEATDVLTFHLTRAVDYAFEGAGGGHAKVVVAMGGKDGFVNTVNVLHQIFYLLTIFTRQTIARRVGDVDHRGSCLDDGFHDAGKIFVVGAASILSIKLHIFHIALGVFDGGYGTLDDFLAGGIELIFYMAVRRSDASVYALMFGIL